MSPGINTAVLNAHMNQELYVRQPKIHKIWERKKRLIFLERYLPVEACLRTSAPAVSWITITKYFF